MMSFNIYIHIYTNYTSFFLFLGIGLQKNSEFRELFNYEILKITESGILGKMRNFWLGGQPVESAESAGSNSVVSLSYNNLLFPFLILCFGILAALLGAGLEKVLGFCIKQKIELSNQKGKKITG